MSTAAELDDYDRQLARVQQEMEQLAGRMTEAQLAWAPHPGKWSIADCLSHLNVTNSSYLEWIGAAIQEGRSKNLVGEGPFRFGFFETWFVRMAEPPVKLKARAPRAFLPAHSAPALALLPEFMKLHDMIRQQIRAADGLHLVRIKVRSPPSPRIRFSLGISFALIAAHDRRHVWQARRIADDPAFPAL